MYSTLVKSIYIQNPRPMRYAIHIIFHILSWYQSTVASFFFPRIFFFSLLGFGRAAGVFRSSLWCTHDLVSLRWCCSASLGPVCVVLWCRRSLLLVVLVFRWLGYSRNSGLFFSAQFSRPSSLRTVFCSLSWCFQQPLFEVSVVFSAVSGYRCSLFLSFGLFVSTSLRYSTVGFYLFSMDSAPVCVKFTGTNYSTWAFQFEFFLKGKALWGHIDGTDVEKSSTSDKPKADGSSPSWAVLDARIMSWLLGSVESHIVTNLRPHRSAQSMWAYLKKVYLQDNDARRF
jgi:hypothetical protein